MAELSAQQWAIATQLSHLKINFQSPVSQIPQSSIAPTLFALLKPSAVVSSFYRCFAVVIYSEIPEIGDSREICIKKDFGYFPPKSFGICYCSLRFALRFEAALGHFDRAESSLVVAEILLQ